MKCVSPASILCLCVLAASGCRTAGLDQLTRPDPPLPRASIDVRDVISEHNRNAERIQSLEARPSITITMNRNKGQVDGKLALERPRNFKLDLSHSAAAVADIGSNDAEFWFWVKTSDAKDKAVYFCNYDDAGGSPMTSTLQPDWIVEALGLRVIAPEEADEITSKPGDTPDTLILTHRPTKFGGESVTRVTLVSKSTHMIKAHELWTGDQKTRLAQAVIHSYQKIDDGSGTLAVIPHKLRLEWTREKIVMDVTIPQSSSTKVNPQFTQARRDALFIEPVQKGYARVNLADQVGTAIRETRPAPPTGGGVSGGGSRAGVQLGEPTPVERERDSDDDAPRQGAGAARPARARVALAPELPPLVSLKDGIVDPPLPSPPEVETYGAQNANTSWKRVIAPTYER